MGNYLIKYNLGWTGNVGGNSGSKNYKNNNAKAK